MLVITLAALGGLWQPLQAAEHVVSVADLHRQVRSAQMSRQAGLEQINGFLHSESSRAVLGASTLDVAQVEKAVGFLSDEEVARLASQIQRLERDIAAGALSNEHLTYIVIALAAAIIVLIAT
ncbi:MAG: hypothetical protein WD733_05920 [Bryobacterales bacterium]